MNNSRTLGHPIFKQTWLVVSPPKRVENPRQNWTGTASFSFCFISWLCITYINIKGSYRSSLGLLNWRSKSPHFDRFIFLNLRFCRFQTNFSGQSQRTVIIESPKSAIVYIHIYIASIYISQLKYVAGNIFHPWPNGLPLKENIPIIWMITWVHTLVKKSVYLIMSPLHPMYSPYRDHRHQFSKTNLIK